MSNRLTALDATFLELEQADESAHMHIGAVMVFDPSEHGRIPSREELCEHLDDRLAALPRYSQRLSQPHTGGLSWPEWERDPDFALATHVKHAALPQPGGERELADWSASFFSQRLDRHRPLWEMVLLEGLEHGRWALATKTHHCMVDGVGSVDVGHLILDAEPDPPASQPSVPARASDRDPDPDVDAEPHASHGLAAIAHAWRGLVPIETAVGVAQAGTHAIRHPREALAGARAAAALVFDEEVVNPAPHTSLNDPIGTQRRFEVVRVPVASLKAVRGALGGTINDVVLSVLAGALRELLISRGELPPEQGLRAMVPMNVRTLSEKLGLGNKISSLFIDLPVYEPDAERRHLLTTASTSAIKSEGRQASGTTAMLGLAGLAPPVLHSVIAQALYANRLFNLTITNVPGPQQPLYAFGSRMVEIHPLVPLAADHALGVAIVSYDGDAYFGVVSDRDTVTDLGVLLEAIPHSMGDLLAAAQARAGERPGARGQRRGRPAKPRARKDSSTSARRPRR